MLLVAAADPLEVRYVHADGHAGIALRRLAGVVLPAIPAGDVFSDPADDDEAESFDSSKEDSSEQQSASVARRRFKWQTPGKKKSTHRKHTHKTTPPAHKDYSSHAKQGNKHYSADDQPYIEPYPKPAPDYPDEEPEHYPRHWYPDDDQPYKHSPRSAKDPDYRPGYEGPYDEHPEPAPRYPDEEPDHYPRHRYPDNDKPYGRPYDPNPYPMPPSPNPEPEPVYDYLLGTDGGLFFSANSGTTYDNGFLNIGIGTTLVTHVMGTPLSRDLITIGTQVSMRHHAGSISSAGGIQPVGNPVGTLSDALLV